MNWNLPNIITASRIVATPFFLWLLLASGGEPGWQRWAAGVFFIVMMLSDAVDGYLARSRNLITDLGKLLDPIADKFLTGSALIGLSILGELPWWITAVVLVREVGITIDRLIKSHDTVIAAALLGKLKTIAQSIAIPLALLPLAALWGHWVVWINIITMTVAVILTIVSGVDYVIQATRKKRV